MDIRAGILKALPWLVMFCGVPLVLYVTGIGCPIKFSTGVSCPGCGMTRAWIEALQLHFDRAFAYHPLFWLIPVVVVACALQSKMPRRLYMSIMIGSIVLLLLVWMARMLLPEQWDVVVSQTGVERVVSVDMPRWVEWFLH